MASFKIRKAQTLGALSAEDDNFLSDSFVDAGYLSALLDTSDPRFLVLGRTGAGKTALLRRIREGATVGSVDPDELSMQHLNNSTLLTKLVEAGVNLDIFYKYLWRHVCVLELIRVRYQTKSDVPDAVTRFFDLSALIDVLDKKKREEAKKQKETREAAMGYLTEYGAEYWIKADTRIRKITEEFESKIGADRQISGDLGVRGTQLKLGIGSKSEDREAFKLEREIVDRAQTIVSDFLISDLAKVVKLLGEHGFSDQQNKRYLLIDDLDKNWMPNSGMYVGLIKSLLHTVRELNRQLPAAKIIVALRNNVFKRVFASGSTLEPQREKWLDVQLPITWQKAELVKFVDNRLAAVARQNYTKEPPRFADFLPQGRARKKMDPEQYILERTLRRPRDLLDFLNTCIRTAGGLETLTWSTIRSAEVEYSARRYSALLEEWKGTYDGLDKVIERLKVLGPEWVVGALSDVILDAILSLSDVDKDVWLGGLKDKCLAGRTFDEIREDIIGTLLEIRFLQCRDPSTHQIVDSSDPMLGTAPPIGADTKVIVHKMFWASLGFSERTHISDPGDDEGAVSNREDPLQVFGDIVNTRPSGTKPR